MASLTGTKIKDTYDGLLKVTDNVGINSTKKIITDGLGNNSSVKISSEDFEVGGFFFIDIDGNVPDSKIGIGTNSPTETLHVVGDFRLTARFFDGSNSAGTSGRVLMSTGSATSWSNTFTTAMTFDAGVILNAGIKDYTGATGTAGQVLSSTGSDVEWVSLSEIQGVDGSGTANYIPIWTDSDTLGNSVIYQSSSNIGIGTLSPGSYKLNVFGDFKLDSNGSGYMQSDYGDHRISIFDLNDNEVISFKDLDSNSANQLVVASTGVGINVANPSEKLHVSGEVLFSGTGVRTTKTVGTDSSLEVQNGISIFRTTNTVGWLLDSNSSNHLGLYNWNRNGYVLKIEDNTPAGTVYINASGYIGIATTSPTYKLHVVSGVTPMAKFEGTTNAYVDFTDPSSSVRLQNSGHSYFGTQTNTDLNFKTNATVKMTIQNGGNIGIGTTSPDKKLDVTVDTSDDGVILQTTSGRKALELIVDNGSNGQGTINFYTGTSLLYGRINADSEGLNFDTIANRHTIFKRAGSETMRIDTSSRVGIGTSSPIEKLHVFNAGFPQLNLESNGGSWQLGVSSGNEFVLRKGSSGSDYAIWVESNLNVGIGTTSPGEKLHVFNAGTAMIKVDSGATSPYKAGIEFLRSSINGGRIYNDGSAVQVKLESDFGYDSNNPTRGGFMFKTAPVTSGTLVDAVRIDALGNVGIGNISPDKKLRVDGDIKAAGDFIGSGLTLGFAGTASIITNDTNENLLINPNGTGKVGIGTTSPTATLHVETADDTIAKFKSTDNKAAISISDDDTTGYFSAENGRVGFGTGLGASSSNISILTSNSNVGIGTVTPQEKLHVMGTIKVSNNGIFGSGGTGSTDAIVSIDGGSDTGGEAYLRLMRGGVAGFILNHTANQIQVRATANIPMFFYTNDTIGIKLNANSSVSFPLYGSGTFTGTATYRLAVDSSGNIIEIPIGSGAVDGSGTANTVTMWSDADTLTDAPITISSNDATFAGDILVNTDTGSYIQIDKSDGSLKFADNNKAKFGTGNDLSIYHTGSLSYINQSGTGKLIIQAENTGINIQSGTGETRFTKSGVNSEVKVDDSSQNNKIVLKANGNSYLNGGNVGIGTTSPAEKLEVAGNITATGSGNTALSVISTGGYSQLITQASDSDSAYIFFKDTSGERARLYSSTSNDLIFKTNGGNTTALTLHNSANATFSGDITTDGSINVNRLAGGTPYDNFKISTADIVTTLERVENTGDANAGYGRLDFKTNAATGHSNSGRGGFKFIDGSDNSILYLDNKDKNATFGGSVTTTDTAGIIIDTTGNALLTIDGASGSTEAIIFKHAGTEVSRISHSNSTNLVFSTGSSVTTALTLDTSQNATFAGNITMPDYIVHTGDADTKIGFNIDDTVEIRCGGNLQINADASRSYLRFQGAAKLYTDTLGVIIPDKLGIGTTSPAEKLHIQGSANGNVKALIENTNTGTNAYATLGFQSDENHSVNPGLFLNGANNSNYAGASSLNMYQYGNFPLGFVTSNTIRMTVTGAGNVGIGTTSPASKLHLYDGDFRITGVFPRIYLQDSNNDSDFSIINGNGNLRFYDDTNASDRLYISASGNVGIGTTSPSEKLSISGGNIAVANGSSIMIGGSIGDTKIGKLYNVSGVLSLDGDGTRNIRLGSTTNGEVVRIDNTNGRVGIGTTSPSEKLEVNGSIKLGSMKLQNLSAGGRIGFNRNTSNGAIYNSSYEAFQIQSNGAGYLETQAYNSSGGYIGSMFFTDTARLGIGTSSPGEKLEVDGSIKLTQFAYDIYFGGTANYLSYNLWNSSASGGMGIKNQASASTGHIYFSTSTGEKVRILRDGSVGIGTTSPEEKLTITSGNIQFRQNASTADTSIGFIGFKNTYATGTHIAAKIDVLTRETGSSVHDYTNISFQTWNGYNTLAEKFRINDSGKIKMNIYGSGTFTGTATYKLAVDTDGNIIELPIGSGAVDGSGAANKLAIWSDADTLTSDTNLHWDTTNNRLGIGITTITDVLQVKSEGADDGIALIKHNNSNQIVKMIQTGTGDGALIAKNTSNVQQLLLRAQGNSYLNGGNVGIGTTSPSYKLDVNGELRSKTHWVDLSATTQRAITSTGTDSIQFGDAGVNDLRFKNASGVSLDIKSTGKVGIGTTAPTQMLHVLGGDENTMKLDASTGQPALFFAQSGANRWEMRADSSHYGLYSYGTSTWEFYILNGNTGIGTTSPSEKLHVSTSNNTVAKFESTDANANIRIGDTVDNTHIGTDGGKTYIGADTSVGGNNLTILSDGKVGIGTGSPTTKLDISDSNPFITIQGTSSSYVNGGIQFISKHASTARGLGNFYYCENSDVEWFSGLPYNNNDAFVINRNTGYTVPSSSSSPPGIGASAGTKFIINSSGNVGIGTTSPSYKLDVNGGAIFLDSDWPLYLGSTSAFIEGNSSGTIVRINATAGFKVTDGGDTRFIIDTDGNVGIGTTLPVNPLHVEGNFTLRGNQYMGDDEKLILGLGSDLQIYHDGSHSYIEDTGTGQLRLKSNSHIQFLSDTNDYHARMIKDQGVELYYDNSKKFETTNTGIAVTGTIASRNIPVLIHTGWGDDTSTTSNLIIPLSNSINETTVSAADGQHFFIAPSNMKVIKVIMKNVSGSVSSSFTTQFKLYKNGSESTTSSEIAQSTNAITWEPTTGNSFVEGDELSLIYQKSATSKYWREVSLTIVLELIHDI